MCMCVCRIQLLHEEDDFAYLPVSLDINFRDGQEIVMSYLPAAHLAGQLLDIYGSITAGATIAFADKEALKGTLVTFSHGQHIYF